MAALERPVKAEVCFTDAEGDSIRLAAECQGGRGRVALHHNGTFFKYIKNLVFVNPEGKLYVNGHEATVLLEATGRGALLEKLHDVCRTGKVYFECADTYDAASALAKVRQSEAEQIEDEMEGASAAMIARAKAAALKAGDAAKKKRVPQPELDKLLGTGVSEVRAHRAFALCGGGTTAEAATAWLAEHKDDATLDDAVDASLLPEFYVPLSEEEREAKARELQAKIAAKKAEQKEEERKREVEREKKRIETDRAARELKEAHEKKKRMEAYELRKREKAEDLKAKAEIRAKINADRIAKGWKPLEDEPAAGEEAEASSGGGAGKKLSAAEFFAKEKQAAAGGGAADDWNPMKFAPAAASDAGAPAVAAAPAAQIPSGEGVPQPGRDAAAVAGELAEKVAALKAAGSGAVKPLVAYVSNIVGEPFELKYRTIKTSNKVFERTVLPAPDALRILLLLGFRKTSTTDEQGVVTQKLTVSSVHLPTFQAAHKLLVA
eukprot:Rhum_TRINITY_DN10879_c0_g2::Rhum_TRINITY_DN10879_c0_g2_i1::g.40496::m.40496